MEIDVVLKNGNKGSVVLRNAN